MNWLSHNSGCWKQCELGLETLHWFSVGFFVVVVGVGGVEFCRMADKPEIWQIKKLYGR